MAHRISRGSRRELVGAIVERYRTGSRSDKRRILTEFVAVTGYHRKHAIRILNGGAKAWSQATRFRRPRVYEEAVQQALVVLWEAADRICGKRLKALLPVLVTALERHGHLKLDDAVRERLFKASAATIDRLLAPTRVAARGGPVRRATALPAIRSKVPIRTFADWKEPPPGYMEADLVAHCGGDMSGSFVHTLVLTDIATEWTECVALVVREAALVVEALTRLRAALPFELRGVDIDNGSEFLNEMLLAYCDAHRITFTRSRPYHKNDQAWVEQKNGAVVRRLVGYRRLQGLGAAEALTRLYAAARLFVNFFQPSFKLAEKTRLGARVVKRYHAPETPCARLLASDVVPDPTKDRLRAVAATLDPLRLLDEIRTVQHGIAELAVNATSHLVPYRNANLDDFLQSLSTAWQEGEVRPTHRAVPKRRRHWRTRKDPFDTVWPEVRGWLDANPDRTATELLACLQVKHPDTFPDDQLRTLQRRVKEWRSMRARELVFAEPDLTLAAKPHMGLVAPAAPGAIPAGRSGSIPL